ncbi:MAG: AbrB/MazE/SpoVT family DNA-binding domain-containing protein [Chloroflexi bacterium]|nr:AbrB/MazE/SpoVT family DNA-binding domain-containing protein [Chloroflexota bacterium]
MDTKVQKWGNSLVVRIPKAYADQMGLTSDSPVKVSVENDRLIITPVRRAHLAELLAEVPPDNIHAETDWGASVGNEGC